MVFLQFVQIFRRFLKISVEKNNWMSLSTNNFVTLPCGKIRHEANEQLWRERTTQNAAVTFPDDAIPSFGQ